MLCDLPVQAVWLAASPSQAEVNFYTVNYGKTIFEGEKLRFHISVWVSEKKKNVPVWDSHVRRVPSPLFFLFTSSADLVKPPENKEGNQYDSSVSDVNLLQKQPLRYQLPG